jgi:hypothetical protein
MMKKEIKMKTEKQENPINDKIHPQAGALADLPVTDEQAQDAKGGPGDRPMESLSINFTKISYKYTPYDS